jgi:hypothetical protein
MNKMCGMTACAIISGANPIPSAIERSSRQRDREIVASARSQIIASGPRANVDNPRRLPARSRGPANEKARSRFPGAGFKILAMLSMYR